MTEIGGLYEDMLKKTISAGSPQIPFFSSSVKAKQDLDTLDLGPTYWRNNLESPVLFHSAVETCIEEHPKDHLFIELGPHSALAGPLRQIFKQRDPKDNISYLSALVRGKDASETFLKLIGQLHLLLIPVNFRALTPTGKVLTDLPTYQWKHDTSYWNESRLTHDW
jgi:acyl transferase domain-containing protein